VTVVPLRRGTSAPLLTKQQLARHLGRSTRWVELRVREGMPSEAPTTRFPHRRFNLEECEAWLRDGRPERGSIADRLAALDAKVASLTAMVEQLGRSA